ncbi:hypothetical protein KGM48_01545 [Patescibacteria group bacterium]|nr:hypothetical protein [Patescibacteria group bacterium]
MKQSFEGFGKKDQREDLRNERGAYFAIVDTIEETQPPIADSSLERETEDAKLRAEIQRALSQLQVQMLELREVRSRALRDEAAESDPQQAAVYRKIVVDMDAALEKLYAEMMTGERALEDVQ